MMSMVIMLIMLIIYKSAQPDSKEDGAQADS